MSVARAYLRRARAELRGALRYVDPRAMSNEVVRSTEFRPGGLPVLLLPGFMSTRRGLTVLERRLRREGYLVFSLNLGGLFNTFNTRSIEELALHVRDKVEKLYQRYDLGPMAIVAHSKGGLVARYYVKRLGGDERCCTVVTLGTPHNGTPAAYLGLPFFGLFAPSIWELMPMSPFIARLREGPFPEHVRLASIWSDADRIAPGTAAKVRESGRDDILNFNMRNLAHHEFIFRKKAFEVIREQLRVGFDAALAKIERVAEAPEAATEKHSA